MNSRAEKYNNWNGRNLLAGFIDLSKQKKQWMESMESEEQKVKKIEEQWAEPKRLVGQHHSN